MPRTSPRSSAISLPRCQVYTAKRTTSATRPIVRALGFRFCVSARMVGQASQAKKLVMTMRRKEVRRASSVWRFSNCSKRELTLPRFSPEGGEPADEPLAGCCWSSMKTGGAKPRGHPRCRRVPYLILETPIQLQQWRNAKKFLTCTYRGGSNRAVDKKGAPENRGASLGCDLDRRLHFGSGVGFGVLLQEVESGSLFGSQLGGFGNFLNRRGCRHFRQQLKAAVMLEARTSGDQAAHDDVFLEAAQIIDFAGHRGFRENTRGLLEAGRRDERVGRERCLGDTKKQRTARRGSATIGDDTVVLLAEAELVHLFLEKELRITYVFDFDPAHHLARDGFDVLVVDVDALEAVNLLNGIDQVGLREFLAEDRKQIVQVERAVDQGLTGLDVIAFLNVDVHAASNGIFLGGLAIVALDVNLAHALGDIAVANRAIDFTDDRGILGLAGFEQFNDAREAAGNVL